MPTKKAALRDKRVAAARDRLVSDYKLNAKVQGLKKRAKPKSGAKTTQSTKTTKKSLTDTIRARKKKLQNVGN